MEREVFIDGSGTDHVFVTQFGSKSSGFSDLPPLRGLKWTPKLRQLAKVEPCP
jgi:hypothetical protein